MYALATGSFSVLRGSSTNVYGDETDAASVVLTGVPMALMPGARGRTSRAEGGLREVDTFTGYAPYGTDLRLDDRIKDETTGEVYVLAVVTTPRTTWGQGDIRVEARRVAGAAASSGVDPALTKVAAGLDLLTAATPSGRVNIVVIGDSNGEGQGAVVESKRWIAVLQDRLRQRANVSGAPVGFLPPAYGGTALSPAPSVIDTSNSGATTTLDIRYGLGARGRQYAKGAFSTWTAFFTSFKIHYAKDSFGVNANVTVDGVAQTAFSCNGTAGGGFVASYGPFSEGQHTVKVQCSDLTLGFIITLEGLSFFQGDETTGLTVYDGSKFGTVTDSFGAEHAKSVAALSPTALVFAQGINDTLVYTPSQSQAKLSTLISTTSAAASASAPSKIVLLHPGRSDVGQLAPYADYVAGWRAAAVANSAYVLDLATVILPAGNPYSAPFFADTVHYSQAGHELVGETFASTLLAR